MLSIEQLTEQIMLLSSSDRALLAERIIESLSFDIGPVVRATWLAEAKMRGDEIRSSAIEPISGEAALSQVIEISRKIDDQYTEANSLYNQALRLTKLYQYREAREKLRQAKQLFAAIGLDDMVKECNKTINQMS